MGLASLLQPLPEVLVFLEREPFWSCMWKGAEVPWGWGLATSLTTASHQQLAVVPRSQHGWTPFQVLLWTMGNLGSTLHKQHEMLDRTPALGVTVVSHGKPAAFPFSGSAAHHGI